MNTISLITRIVNPTIWLTLLLALPMLAQASIIRVAPEVLQPAGLNPGESFFVIFVTSARANYNMYANSGLIDTDGITSAAGGTKTSGVTSGWRSLYGFETSAGTGTLNTMDAAQAWGNVIDRPIYTTTGVRVANNRADMLDNTLLAAIGFDENGNVPDFQQVFTGLTSSGAIAANALGHGEFSGAQFGLNGSVTGTWAASANANISRHLYVLSPLLTVANPGSISVTAPSSWLLIVFGGLMLRLMRRH